MGNAGDAIAVIGSGDGSRHMGAMAVVIIGIRVTVDKVVTGNDPSGEFRMVEIDP